MIGVMLCHNGSGMTRACLESIEGSKDWIERVGFKLVLVDNGSGDNTGEVLSEFAGRWPGRVVVERNESNGWFTVVNSDVVGRYPGEDVYMLNNDILVGDGWLSGMDYLREWGMISATNVMYGDGRVVTFGGGGDDFMSHKVWWEWKERGLPEIHEEKWVTGCSVMVNRAAYDKVGGLSRDLLHYCSDSDLSLKMTAAGYKVGVKKGMRVVHLGSQTFRAVTGGGNEVIARQGVADHENFARKWRLRVGQFNYSVGEPMDYHKEVFGNDLVYMRNLKAAAEEAELIKGEYKVDGMRILELGCAFGEIGVALIKAGADYRGVDYVDCVRDESLKGRVSCSPLVSADFGVDNDLVFSRAVLEHLTERDIKGILIKVRDSLKVGGVFDNDIDTFKGTDPTHTLIMPIEKWREWFIYCGFEEVKTYLIHGGVYRSVWRWSGNE